MPLTPVARTVPTGKMLKDGHRTTFTMQNYPGLNLKEKEVKGVGYDGNEEIDTTTMFNNLVRTYAPRKLIKGTAAQVKASYDTDVLPTLLGQINTEQSFTETYPNGSTLCWYGFLKSAEREAHKEGEQPTFNLTVVPTFADPSTGAEVLPVFTDSGTG